MIYTFIDRQETLPFRSRARARAQPYLPFKFYFLRVGENSQRRHPPDAFRYRKICAFKFFRFFFCVTRFVRFQRRRSFRRAERRRQTVVVDLSRKGRFHISTTIGAFEGTRVSPPPRSTVASRQNRGRSALPSRVSSLRRTSSFFFFFCFFCLRKRPRRRRPRRNAKEERCESKRDARNFLP